MTAELIRAKYQILEGSISPALLEVTNSPEEGWAAIYDVDTGSFSWVSVVTGSGSMAGGGVIVTGGFTGTLPADGTLALLEEENIFTAAQKINLASVSAMIIEQSGVVDNVLVVDTINGRVAINIAPTVGAFAVNGTSYLGSTANATAVAVTGKTSFSGQVTTSSGANAVNFFDGYAYSGAGSQHMNTFFRNYTVAGQSTVQEFGSIYTVLYHSAGFTLPEWKGIETGAAYVSGAGSVIDEAWAIDCSLPACSDGGTVGIAAGVHIGARSVTGITSSYAIYSLLTRPSLFSSTIQINDGVGVGFDIWRDGGQTSNRITAYQDSATSGANTYYRFARGSLATPASVQSSDVIYNNIGYGYIDGDFREISNIRASISGTPSATNYSSALLLRIVKTNEIALSTVLRFDPTGNATFGSSAGTGDYRIYVSGITNASSYTGTGSFSITTNGPKFNCYEDDVATTDAYFKLTNATGGAGLFTPQLLLKGNRTGSATNNQILADSNSDVVTDTGEVLNISLRAANVAVANRPLLTISNYTTVHFKMDVNGNSIFGGGAAAPAAKLHSLAITEQLRLGYDAANYASFTVAAAGGLTIATVGNMTLTPSATVTLTDAKNFVFGTTTGSMHGTAANQKQSFWGATPIVQPVLAAYTSDGEGAAYTGIDNAQAGAVYATVADLNALRVAYETLRAAYDDLRTKTLTTGILA